MNNKIKRVKLKNFAIFILKKLLNGRILRQETLLKYSWCLSETISYLEKSRNINVSRNRYQGNKVEYYLRKSEINKYRRKMK